MKCLHICNGFLGSKVHEHLYRALSTEGLEQTVYYFVRNDKLDIYESTEGFDVVGSKPLKIWHKVFFRNKIKFLFKDLLLKVNVSEYDIVHATTLFSDGALALKIYKNFQIPYVLAIRGADVNAYFRYRPDLVPLAKEILQNASRLVFISRSLEKNFYNISFIDRIARTLRPKSIVIFNGLDRYWLKNILSKKEIVPFRVLYIGNLTRNKNVVRLVNAVLKARNKYPNLQLAIVGHMGEQEAAIKTIASKYNGVITYHGPIYEKAKLRKIYQNAHLFAMTSIGETFGLVYVEALSQGLPVMYSQNQGIDGSFDYNIGESVDPKSVVSITAGLEKMIEEYESYDLDNIDFSVFDWRNISKRYLEIYHAVCITSKN